jgi:creatinine amidohydrolase
LTFSRIGISFNKMLLEEITMQEFSDGLSMTKTVIIPFGSVEEHGAHLPIGTDTIHVYELAKEVSRLRKVFVAPPVWYGLCRSTSRHPGTISISMDTVRRLAEEIAVSFYRQGIRNFILISGHAGGTHMAAIVDAGEAVMERFDDCKVAALSVLDLVARLPEGLVETPDDSHAGEVETSLMLLLRPFQVKGEGKEEYPSFPKPILVKDKLKCWPGGVWGDPVKASLAKGKDIFNLEAFFLTELIDNIENT